MLLVDSDVKVLQLLTSYMQNKGYTVHTALDGKEGVKQCEATRPDLVITELNLSALGGYQFIEQVRTMDRTHTPEVVVLTNKQQEEDMKRTFDYGVAEYMTKPFSLIELEARVKRLLTPAQ
ncbi:response regulator [Pontibacillus halophilus JSM 076056 = DSM 19796]|uniref:Response regulator n=1 Tax=Pontibacillus halophilus JSM 076056 = DSM 19796 TaxID=1385510 RepID=A0A0A5GD15_9BACI|nr:response regulator [Pontibacillus halophilus JSM 076056 = DSM 19796]